MDTHRVCEYIDLDAFDHNIQEIQKKLNNGSELMSIVKADGYGHGAITLAKEIERIGGKWIAVATIDEAVELRKNGIKAKIIILSPVYKDYYNDLFEYNIIPTVFEYSIAETLNQMAKERNTVIDIHIKLDTGMGRIGFSISEESADIIKKISDMSNINIQGIFSHFANSDVKGRDKTDKQFELYKSMIDMLSNRGVNIPVKHIANSAGIMAYPETYMNLVRAGIIMYGLYPSDEVDKSLINLKPVMSIKSHIAYIKNVKPGATIGYGSTFVADKDMTIATIPVGYADGWPRSLSNKGRVLINGKYAPIKGRICMDQFMVDITDIDAKEGDIVTLVGKDGGESISVEEHADLAGSFNYEFVCNISRRVPRVYLRNGEIEETVAYFK